MQEEARILLDRLEAIARRLDRYIFLLMFLIISAGSTFFPNANGSEEVTFLTIAIHDIVFFKILLASGMILIFGMIGSNLIDYKLKRRTYFEVLEPDESSEVRAKLISRSIYEYIYGANKKNDPSRKLAFVVLILILVVSNSLALILIWTTTFTYFYLGWSLLISILVVMGVLTYSYWTTVRKI